MPAALFTEESPFTFDNVDADKFRRIVRRPTFAESFRPEFKPSTYVLPRMRPHKGPPDGTTVDPRFQSTSEINRFARKVK